MALLVHESIMWANNWLSKLPIYVNVNKINLPRKVVQPELDQPDRLHHPWLGNYIQLVFSKHASAEEAGRYWLSDGALHLMVVQISISDVHRQECSSHNALHRPSSYGFTCHWPLYPEFIQSVTPQAWVSPTLGVVHMCVCLSWDSIVFTSGNEHYLTCTSAWERLQTCKCLGMRHVELRLGEADFAGHVHSVDKLLDGWG